MSNEDFGNYAFALGRVSNKEFRGDIGNGLGKLTLSINDGKAYIDLWNPKGTAKVEEFFNNIIEGDKIQIKGRLKEEYYQDSFTRKLSPFINSTNGVPYELKSEDELEKFNAALSGDILEKKHGLEGENNIPKMNITLGIFNLYNPETKENDLTRQQVLIKEITGYREYLLSKNSTDKNAITTLDKILDKIKSDDSKENLFNVLLKFYELYQPRMWNIDILHLTGTGEMAEELSNKVDEKDNASFGVSINNMMDIDEYGFVNGVINTVEIKKIHEVYKNEENVMDEWEL